MKTTQTNQSNRILKALQDAKGDYVPMPKLSRLGSGIRNGWTASFSRRISDLRKDGHCINKRETRKGFKRLTEYALV